jgi:cell growth-regulating nucleolar protein
MNACAQGHTSCVTEHEKYALAATKPGGAGAQSAPGGGGGGTGGGGGGAASGLQFLATRAPWLCSCCGVTCTSQETLAGHASGKKHKSKARAAEGGGAAAAGGGGAAAAAAPAAAPAAAAPADGVNKRPAETVDAAPAAKAARSGAADAAKPSVTAAAPAAANIKWKKLATDALRAAPGQRLKASKLRRAVLAAARAKHGAGAGDDDALAAAYDARIGASSRFVTGADGLVGLSAGGEADE